MALKITCAKISSHHKLISFIFPPFFRRNQLTGNERAKQLVGVYYENNEMKFGF